MTPPPIHRVGDLQLSILKVLWERKEATVAEVHERLESRELAHNTIATMLRKMESRGWVRHRADGRTFVYRAAITSDAVMRGVAHHLLDRLFEGSLADMVSHLLQTREVSQDELGRLARLIAERKKSR